MLKTAETGYWIGLSHSFLSSRTLNRLLGVLGSAEAIWTAPAMLLEPHLDADQLQKLNRAKQNDPERLAETYHKLGIQVVPISHGDYPPLLKQTADPPFVLYVRGSVGVLQQKGIAVVGTRRYTDYGRRVVENLIGDLKPYQPCIFSGLAAGIDTVAHCEALKFQLPTVAVFGTGIDQVYPKSNDKLAQCILEAGGALISEYPIGMHGGKYTFPQRNRIIAGLSQGTLVVEGDVSSGALITAKNALDENRQVFAVPGNIFSPNSRGPNKLIQQGAVPVQEAQDIVQSLQWLPDSVIDIHSHTAQKEAFADVLEKLPKRERDVLSVVGYEPTTFETIQSQKKELTVVDLQMSLTMLELQGLITALPGTKFCRN